MEMEEGKCIYELVLEDEQIDELVIALSEFKRSKNEFEFIVDDDTSVAFYHVEGNGISSSIQNTRSVFDVDSELNEKDDDKKKKPDDGDDGDDDGDDDEGDWIDNNVVVVKVGDDDPEEPDEPMPDDPELPDDDTEGNDDVEEAE